MIKKQKNGKKTIQKLEPLDFDKCWQFGTHKNMSTRDFIAPILNHINEQDHLINELIKKIYSEE